MSEYTDDLWDIFRDTFGKVEFYVNDSKEPAFLICSTEPRRNHLLMNKVGKIGEYGSLKKAKDRLKDIIETANIPVKVFSVSRRGKKALFAANTVSRVHLKEDCPCKVFEIREWNNLLNEKSAEEELK